MPPPCLRCGANRGYYTSGVCARCHPAACPAVDSCPDCYAWGATRTHKWLCHGCLTWRKKYPTVGDCSSCARSLHLHAPRGCCRLCYKQASLTRGANGTLDLAGANRYGQQLFLADMFLRRGLRRAPPAVVEEVTPPLAGACEQLTLFTVPRDLSAHGRRALHERADPRRAAVLDRHTRDLAAELGWSPRQVKETRYGLRIVLGIQDATTGRIKASDVNLLTDIDLPVWTVLAVLGREGILDEDRFSALDAWFAGQVTGLPAAMTEQLWTWFGVMKYGSPTPPRRRPRHDTTINLHTRWALPAITAWAAAGHTSLREITRGHVLDALPVSGNPRSQAGQGLRSVFLLLKSRGILFVDPTLRVKTGEHQTREPLPADLNTVRGALNSPRLAQAAVVALIAFHGLRASQLRHLHLTDLRDGRIHLDGRIIVLAEPVRVRVSAYLDYRQQRWPQTANPHLFIHYRSAGRTEPVGMRWVWLTVGPGLSAAGLREDRILNEAHATGGDARRLADLFGLSITATDRYTATVDHPDLTRPGPADPANHP